MPEDFDNVLEFGRQCEVLTIEIEKVNTEALQQLEDEGVQVYPPASVIRTIQDKGIQKQQYVEMDIPTAPFVLWSSGAELKAAVEKGELTIPFVWKARKGGYDGRGVSLVKSDDQLRHIPDEAPCLTEDLIPFETEVACLAARSASGEMTAYPLVGMDFHPEANLVENVHVPSGLSSEIEDAAREMAFTLMSKWNHVGLLALEFFLLADGSLLLNEVAPRPHNSGHLFSDCAYTSQFEQHLRAVTGLPLGSTEVFRPAVMINLVGEEGHSGSVHYDGAADLLKEKGVYLHLYGKMDTRPFRKRGDVTIVDDTLESAKNRSREVRKRIKIMAQ
jgi:5-(carboxyamino)imidazole ribonucleotide synthase